MDMDMIMKRANAITKDTKDHCEDADNIMLEDTKNETELD